MTFLFSKNMINFYHCLFFKRKLNNNFSVESWILDRIRGEQTRHGWDVANIKNGTVVIFIFRNGDRALRATGLSTSRVMARVSVVACTWRIRILQDVMPMMAGCEFSAIITTFNHQNDRSWEARRILSPSLSINSSAAFFHSKTVPRRCPSEEETFIHTIEAIYQSLLRRRSMIRKNVAWAIFIFVIIFPRQTGNVNNV